MKKYTLIFHRYLGNGWYNIEFKRVRCSPTALKFHGMGTELHYIIKGWPTMTHPNGEEVDMGGEI